MKVYDEAVDKFKTGELKAKDEYLDGLVGRMDPRKPEQFFCVVNKVIKKDARVWFGLSLVVMEHMQ